MSFLDGWSERTKHLFRRRELERELDEEMAFHVEQDRLLQENAGTPSPEALRTARLRFGTTLLSLLGLLDSPSDGVYSLDGKDVSHLSPSELARVRNREIGFIFQAFNLIGDLTVYENVELPLMYRGMSGAERKQRVHAALERVGMSHRMKHYPPQLSGGQQQRVAVARAIVGKPLMLLADEPTGNLDSSNGEAVMDLLKELHADGATICMVTHDPRYARHAERSMHLFDGQIVRDEDANKSHELKESGFEVHH